MGVRTNQKQTLNVLNAHMNSRCEDDNCETCPLRNTKLTKEIDYCYAMLIFAEKFEMDNALRTGTKFIDDYTDEVNEKFSMLFHTQW